ncbi:MAG: DNA/RNA non-specific endonuclease [Prochlorotrichaceae cyanobacterium]
MIVSRDIYCLAADPETKFADFVAFRLDATTIGSSQVKTDREWEPDPDLDPAITLEPEDYRGANAAIGTDRGHLAPLASFKGANWQQTNYLSNIVPQDSDFNRGVWADLENDIRDMARRETIYVVVGTAYLESMPSLPGADEPHVIPSGLWTIVTSSAGTQAWYFDQDTTAKDPAQGEIPIADLEAMLGIKFAR